MVKKRMSEATKKREFKCCLQLERAKRQPR